MVAAILGGVIIFFIFACVLMTGISQAKIHKENQLKDRIKSYFNRVRHHQDLMEAIPSKYFPQSMRIAIVSDIINSLNQALKLLPSDEKAKRTLAEYQSALKALQEGEVEHDSRVINSLVEAEGCQNLLEKGWKILSVMKQEGQLSVKKIDDIKKEIEVVHSIMQIDAELGIAEAAKNELKLSSAHYHYHNAILLLMKSNIDDQYSDLIEYARTEQETITLKIKETGGIIPNYDDNAPISKMNFSD